VLSDLCEGIQSWTKLSPQTSEGCENLVPASPHTASGETSVHALQNLAKRASSIGISLDK